MNNRPTLQQDIDTISRIPAVATILEVVCRTTGMGFAAIARVTEDSWVACAVRDEIEFGLVPGGELKLETTICHEIRQKAEAVVIDHVSADAVYAHHHTPAMYGFQSYISFPIILKNGSFFGTLCAIDPRPNQLNTPRVTGMFRLFAELIAFHLYSAEQLVLTEAKLSEERRTAELREQFIAVLGHDLGNPAAAINSSAQILQQMQLPENAGKFVDIIQHSGYRIKGLINNVMDFASGRMGGGIVLNRKDNEPIATIIEQVISELRMVWPGRQITARFDLKEPVNCDGARIAQLFSNLLGNALKYGDAASVITVSAESDREAFTLSVTNCGKKIPDVIMSRLFLPFFRGTIIPEQQGLGLGLYIASEIALAHHGRLKVSSTHEATQFSLWLPHC